ncbi:MAG: AMP-binding protein, partial [Hyphomonadaceae bacterium]|nr:AMP-binding protein [Hyphomonadaceae bacterium]
YPELVWAAKNSGLHYVAVSSHLNAPDVAHILMDSGARLLVVSPSLADVAAEALRLSAVKVDVLCLGNDPRFPSYHELARGVSDAPMLGRRRGSSMLYSSGTTGRPKGVRVDLADVPPDNAPPRQIMLQETYEFGGDTIFINPGPFYHAAPLRFMMAVQRAGGTVIGFQKFDAAATLQAIAQYKATHGFFVPTMFIRMLRLKAAQRAGADLSSMRYAIHAAAPCPVDVKRAMIEWWGPVIHELYSGTEAVGHTFINSDEWLAHPGSVGRAANGCTIKIVDEAGRTLPAGTPGRIFMTNGRRFAYHNDPDKTASIHDDEGYASLGDVGYLDADGYLYLTDRETHMIISGGVNIYPQEAENILSAHPAIQDVAVIGVPHPELGEEVKAIVLPFEQPLDVAALGDDIIKFCRERLSPIKCPRSVDFVSELPRNDLGKLQKRLLKDRYWQGRDSRI